MHPVLALLTPANEAQPAKARVSALDQLAVFEITGADAISFIQAQITNDIAGAPAGEARLAGYCTPQGRLLATFVIWREAPGAPQDAPTLRAIVSADIAAALLKRLSMFVLRAKARLAPVPLSVAGVSCTPEQARDLAAALGQPLPQVPWQVAFHASGTWIAAPAVAGNRWWWVAPAGGAGASAALTAQLSLAQTSVWMAEDIAAGLPWIEAATQDLFIPQTVNLDLVGGVSFTKGCYPGQEIVARSHYRGTLKRRMALGKLVAPDPEAETAIKPASDVYDATSGGEPCGRIINIATSQGETLALFEATFDAVARGALHAGSMQGPALTPCPLPYDTRPVPRTT